MSAILNHQTLDRAPIFATPRRNATPHAQRENAMSRHCNAAPEPELLPHLPLRKSQPAFGFCAGKCFMCGEQRPCQRHSEVA